MYFWQINALKERMRAGPVPARDVLGYAMMTAVSWNLFTLLRPSKMALPRPDLIPALATLCVLLGGLWFAYPQNGGEAGKDFAGRLMAFWWVLGLRFFVTWMVVTLAIPFILVIAGTIPEDPNGPGARAVVYAMFYLYTLLFLWRLSHHMGEVAAAPVAEQG